jgi:putative transposase
MSSVKYTKARKCLEKDKQELLAFYNSPAENRDNLKVTNPIELTFATIGLRHCKTEGGGTRKTNFVMMFELAETASERWRLQDCYQHIISLNEGTKSFN